MRFEEETIPRMGHPDSDPATLTADIRAPEHFEVTGASASGARIAYLDSGGEPTEYEVDVHQLNPGESITGMAPDYVSIVNGTTVVTLVEVAR